MYLTYFCNSIPGAFLGYILSNFFIYKYMILHVCDLDPSLFITPFIITVIEVIT